MAFLSKIGDLSSRNRILQSDVRLSVLPCLPVFWNLDGKDSKGLSSTNLRKRILYSCFCCLCYSYVLCIYIYMYMCYIYISHRINKVFANISLKVETCCNCFAKAHDTILLLRDQRMCVCVCVL